jgi:predicted metal-dependent phosphoesterase TrpH
VPVELHSHSTASDGTLSPAALVATAAAAGIDTLALTDHDTVGGVDEAVAAGTVHGLRIVPGIELSVRVARGTFHLLGYLPTTCPAPLAARLEEIANGRDARNHAIVERLRELGAAVEWSDVRARAAGRVGRPHIADALVAAGHATDRVDAFDRYLGEAAPAYLSAGILEPDEAIALVKACGGAATLAHPATLRLDPAELEAVVAGLAAAGLDALEAHRCDASPDEQATFAAIAARHGLLATGGSDYHGPDSERWGKRLGATGTPGADPAALTALLARVG